LYILNCKQAFIFKDFNFPPPVGKIKIKKFKLSLSISQNSKIKNPKSKIPNQKSKTPNQKSQIKNPKSNTSPPKFQNLKSKI